MIKVISNPLKKELIARTILYDLPEWFGIPEATEEYINKSRDMLMFVSLDDNNEANGFVCIEPHNTDTIEIYVMGVLKKQRKKGIGRDLIKKVNEYAKAEGYKLIEVKTLDESFPDQGYQETRLFYQSVGFSKLETILSLWGETCPCLIMVKIIS